MKSIRKQILSDAKNYIVVSDGQFQYPVKKSSLHPGDTEEMVKDMSGEEYDAWCQDVPADLRVGEVGTWACIDLCRDLIDAGADEWDVE